MSEPHKNLAEALAAFQGEAPKLHKGNEANAGSYKYKYVDLASVVDAIQEPMCTHGLSFSALPCVTSDGKPGLRYTLRHASGDADSEVMPLMLAKADAQAMGSAISYARRYALCAALNLVADEDDDGAAAKAAAERQPSVDFRSAASGLTGAQIREAFRGCALQPPGPEVPTWQLFENVPADKAAVLAEALRSVER